MNSNIKAHQQAIQRHRGRMTALDLERNVTFARSLFHKESIKHIDFQELHVYSFVQLVHGACEAIRKSDELVDKIIYSNTWSSGVSTRPALHTDCNVRIDVKSGNVMLLTLKDEPINIAAGETYTLDAGLAYSMTAISKSQFTVTFSKQ